MSGLSYVDAIVLGIVEGLTEFLPVSSTGHLTIAERLLGLSVDDRAVTAYTALIQLGAIAATLLYFRHDIARLAAAWFAGLRDPRRRGSSDYPLAWAVILGSLPIALAGLLGRSLIVGPFRSLWVVAAGLLLWSVVMWAAERRHAALTRRGEERGESTVTVRDGVVMGLVQCLALVPGVSRSGATISAGLLRGIDRVAATRLSFFLAIPALTAAGLFEATTTDLSGLGTGQMVLGVAVAFAVAYASIAWLLRFVATNTLLPFVWYRVVLGAGLAVALGAGWLPAR